MGDEFARLSRLDSTRSPPLPLPLRLLALAHSARDVAAFLRDVKLAREGRPVPLPPAAA